MKENRMGFPGVGSPKQDNIRLFDLAVGTGSATQAEYCRQTGDTGSMSSTVVAIDVVRAKDCPGELLDQEIQFVGRLRTAENPNALRAA